MLIVLRGIGILNNALAHGAVGIAKLPAVLLILFNYIVLSLKIVFLTAKSDDAVILLVFTGKTKLMRLEGPLCLFDCYHIAGHSPQVQVEVAEPNRTESELIWLPHVFA